MTNKELADLMFPNVKHDIAYYENLYPSRNLDKNQIVTRFAPSPTGFVHMGSLLTSFIAKKVTEDTNGIFYLRIEDTDGKRSVENGISGIINDLKNFNIDIDEGVISFDKQVGNYGPYIQSERKEIYETYAKYLVEKGLAYPCFCKSEEIDDIRKIQELNKERIGYYGSYAKCRYLTNEERIERIKNGEKYIVRLASPGDFNKKISYNDLARGTIEFPENDLDIVLIKSDGLPLYHFAHVIDDHLMHTTHVLRGEEWISSTPIHLQLFDVLGFERPKYAHLGVVMKIDEDGTRRKLSKRKDPEAAVSFYHEQGIPVEAVKIYLMTIANSNFEGWWLQNQDSSYNDFKLDFKKISVSGTLYDLEKLLNISRTYISKLTKEEVYNEVLNWASEYDKEFYNILLNNKEYSMNIFNIEREQAKPRKDYESFSSIKGYVWYMYNEYFNKDINYEFNNITDKDEIINIVKTYLDKYYDSNDDKETWFNKIKLLTNELGYCSDMKEYKLNPSKYKGNVSDVSTVIRVLVTSKSKTPDLYDILKLLGKEELYNRLNKYIG